MTTPEEADARFDNDVADAHVNPNATSESGGAAEQIGPAIDVPQNDEDSNLAELLTIKAVGDFDLEALPDQDREAVRGASHLIREAIGAAKKSVVDIGKNLVTIKNTLGHGRFGDFLKAEFAWSERKAQRFMNVAQVFDGKNDIVSHLPSTALYELAAPSTPAAVRDEIIAEVEAGHVPDIAEVKRRVATGRAAAALRSQRAAQLSEASREAHARDKARQLAAARAAVELIVSKMSGEDKRVLYARLLRTTPIEFFRELTNATEFGETEESVVTEV